MIEALGHRTLQFFWHLTTLLRLAGECLSGAGRQLFRLKFRYRETIEQCYSIGVQSLPVVAFSLTFISLMLIVEFSYHMKLVVRQDSLVPAFSTVLIIRELGPVVTCLLLASRVGAGIAAEIGTMKITDQLDALRLLGVDPVDFLTVPRWFACVFATLSLSVISIGVAILGGAFIASAELHQPVGQFFNTMFLFTRWNDFASCFWKAAAFGTLIPIVASHHGYACRPGAEGVGTAATSAVVHASVIIIIVDFALTYLLHGG